MDHVDEFARDEPLWMSGGVAKGCPSSPRRIEIRPTLRSCTIRSSRAGSPPLESDVRACGLPSRVDEHRRIKSRWSPEVIRKFRPATRTVSGRCRLAHGWHTDSGSSSGLAQPCAPQRQVQSLVMMGSGVRVPASALLIASNSCDEQGSLRIRPMGQKRHIESRNTLWNRRLAHNWRTD